MILMHRIKLIHCNALDYIPDDLEYNLNSVEQAFKLTVDCAGIVQAFEMYKIQPTT